MKKEILELLINECLETGADFSEIFFEDKKETNISFSSSIINKSSVNKIKGVGIRISKDEEVYYAATNDLDDANLLNSVKELRNNFKSKRTLPIIKFNNPKEIIEIKRKSLEELKLIKEKLYKYDNYARSLDPRVSQVLIGVLVSEQIVSIANSYGNLIHEARNLARLAITVIVKENDKTESTTFNVAVANNLDFNDEEVFVEIKNAVEATIKKLTALGCPGGQMPVIIGNGVGGVLIHEACGHALEATFVADKMSVLSEYKDKKVASDIVTIIDDGSIIDSWGSTIYDDEGNKTRKNILIENGILKNFLVDEINKKKIDSPITGSARREDYTFSPTSRMNNTYMANGNSSVEEMINSINYGLYAKRLGGGQVNPATGDFNFAVLEAYLIKNGKIAEPVKGATLVGNTLEILNNVEMVGNDLKLSAGVCGSKSGHVPVTVGEPTIKVSKILVGGENND